MIQDEFISQLKSELFYSSVGQSTEVFFAVISKSGLGDGCVTEIRVETLNGITASSSWKTTEHHIAFVDVDQHQYFCSGIQEVNPEGYNIDCYLRSNFFVFVFKPIV